MKKITAETLMEFRFPGSPRISPDGTMTAMLVKQPDMKENKYISDIWVYDHQTKETVHLTAKGSVADFCWMPCGSILFTLAGEKSEKGVCTNYYKISPKGGEALKLCSLPVRSGMPVFLPGEEKTWLVSALTDLLTDEENPSCGNDTKARCGDYRIFEEVPFWSNGNGDVSKRRHTLFVAKPCEGTVARLTPVNFDVMSYDVQGSTVLITGAAFDDVNPHEKGLYAADTCTMEMKELIAPYTYEIGTAKLLCCEKALVQMKKMGTNRYASGDLCSVNVKTGEIEVLHDMDYSIGGVGVTTDAAFDGGKSAVVENGTLYFIKTEFDSCYLRTCDSKGVIGENLTQDGATTSIDVKNGHVVMVAMRGDKLPELYELNEQGEEVCLTSFNDCVSAELCVSTPEFFTYTGSDGFDIHGFVMKPAGYKEGKKYPVILNIHGGPRGVFGSVFHHEMQLWANSGYFVIYSNPRGSDGRGEKFANLYGTYGDWDYVNLMEFTDECLKRYPDMDADRMGVTGGSYGGYMTNWIIGKTDRFKAACAQRSISNWITYEGTGDISYWFNEGEHGATIENAEKLWDISPMKFADKAKTPTLFIHSDQDYRCFMGEGITMYTVLKMNGVDTRLVLFKGENHNLSRNGRPRSRVRRMEEIVSWMDKYLKEGEQNA